MILLFHRIGELESSQVRKLVVDLGLKEKVDFRNVGVGTRDIGILKEKAGNDRTPAILVDDSQIIQGLENISKYLKSSVTQG